MRAITLKGSTGPGTVGISSTEPPDGGKDLPAVVQGGAAVGAAVELDM